MHSLRGTTCTLSLGIKRKSSSVALVRKTNVPRLNLSLMIRPAGTFTSTVHLAQTRHSLHALSSSQHVRSHSRLILPLDQGATWNGSTVIVHHFWTHFFLQVANAFKRQSTNDARLARPKLEPEPSQDVALRPASTFGKNNQTLRLFTDWLSRLKLFSFNLNSSSLLVVGRVNMRTPITTA
jgi:hypothetical protein